MPACSKYGTGSWKSIDVIYGLKATAAAWGDLTGCAEQIITPFYGCTLQTSGIIKWKEQFLEKIKEFDGKLVIWQIEVDKLCMEDFKNWCGWS